MKTITRRISKLEERFAPRLDEFDRSVAEQIRESRHRRLAAEGREPEGKSSPFDADYRPRTIAEAIRSARLRRRGRLIRAEAGGGDK